MRKMTYEQLQEIIQKEGTITSKNISIVLAELVQQSDEEYGEFGEYEYENDPRTKMRELADAMANEGYTFYADANDYHNIAVDYARQNLPDCSIRILQRGIMKYPFSSDLLADLILYGKESGEFEVCKSALDNLMRVDRKSWGWRAYSFSIDYYMDEINKLPAGDEHKELYTLIHSLADEYIAYSERQPSAIDRAYCKKADVIKEIGGEDTSEEYLLKGCSKYPLAPQCSLHLADMLVERGEYDKAITHLDKCKLASISVQPDISPSYVHLLYAMTKTSQLLADTSTTQYEDRDDEIDAIYKDFHIAMKYSYNQTYEKAAKNTIKMIEIQTGHKDNTYDPEGDENY